MNNILPDIDVLVATMQDFVETISYDKPADPTSPDPDETVKKGLAHVLKYNPYHDSKDGRFTSKDKAGHNINEYVGSLNKIKQAVFVIFPGVNPKEYLESPQGKEHLKTAAKHYVKYTKHMEAMGETPVPFQKFIDSNVPEFSEFLGTKVKASIGATKASAKIAQNHAIQKLHGPEMKELWQKMQDGDNKAMAKYAQKQEHYKKQFVQNGGDPGVFASESLKALAGEKSGLQATITPKTTLTPTPPKKAAPEPVKEAGRPLQKYTAVAGVDAVLAQHTKLGLQKLKTEDAWNNTPSGVGKHGEDLMAVKDAAQKEYMKSLSHIQYYYPDVDTSAQFTKIKAMHAQGAKVPEPVQSTAPAKPKVPLPDGFGNAATVLGDDGVPKVRWPDVDKIGGLDKQDSLIINNNLGMAYYMKRTLHGQESDDTKKAYAEWQKSKDYLTSTHGVGKDEIGQLSLKSKNAVETAFESVTLAEKQAQAKIAQAAAAKAKAKTDAAQTVKAAAAVNAQFLDHPTQKVKVETLQKSVALAVEKAKAEGWSDEEIESFMGEGTKNGKAAFDKEKQSALDNVQTLSYASGMKKSTGSKEEYKQALKEYQEAKEKAAAFGHNKADIDKLSIKGTAQAVAAVKKYKKLQEAMGEAGKTASQAYAGFSPIQWTVSGYGKFEASSLSISGSEAEKAHVAWSENQWNSLTPEERSALHSHLGGGYTAMNKGSNKHEKAIVEKALNKTTLGVDMEVRRNMAQRWLFQGLGIDEATWKTQEGITGPALQALVGRTYTEKATMSTTKNLTSNICYQGEASKSGMLAVYIRAHKNTKGLDTNIAANAASGEAEVTLAPNQTMVITKIERTDYKGFGDHAPRYNVYVDMLGPLEAGKIVSDIKP